MAVSPIPAGHHTVTPHLVIKGAAQAIEFYKKAFGAQEINRVPGPEGKLLHAEIKIGDSFVYLADEVPDWGIVGPADGKSPVVLHLYVPDTDKAFAQAISAGGTAVMPPMDAFWGDRYAKLTDPFGHHWSIATHMKDLTPEQMMEGMKQAMGESCQ